MSFEQVFQSYREFTRQLAEKAGAKVDAWLSPRQIRTETSNFVLGAEATPAPVRIPDRQR